MGYEDRIPEKIGSMEEHRDQTLALWRAIAESFEAEGADGVEDELARRTDDIHRRFSAALAKLEAML